ncbi:SdpI family protein [Limibacter armeniacum]|uniref:SdpI family protein n=1 Tax=Limibacter armeniacum TaxID=466084 RepID=UPI002FE69CA8
MKSELKNELLLIMIAIFPLLYLLGVWELIPDKVPLHWNLSGEADRYGDRMELFYLVIGLPTFIYVLMMVVRKIDPRKKNYEIFKLTYEKIRLLMGLTMSVICCVIIYAAIGEKSPAGILSKVLFVMIALMGNYMGTIRPNFFIGIRTPWTLASDTVWKKTHRLAGKLWFWAGVLGLGISFLLPPNYAMQFCIVVLLVVAFIPVGYSYYIFREEKA